MAPHWERTTATEAVPNWNIGPPHEDLPQAYLDDRKAIFPVNPT
jgi:hypothetical protein